MERTISVEEKIKRAEEIYARRNNLSQKDFRTETINVSNKKDIKLLKKIFIQIVISLLIYFVFYTIKNNKYIFSEDFLNKSKEILSYDTDFGKIYTTLKERIENIFKNKNLGIGGAVEEIEEVVEEVENTEINKIEEVNEKTENKEENIQKEKEEENTSVFIKPVEGVISSKYGQRMPTTSGVPKNHTGIDIAANTGDKIISSTDGEVILSSEKGDYGKHLKIQTGEMIILYAHCNNLYVKKGDIVKQGQEIAEVGSTGNSTGPHLHFEIRVSGKTVDPETMLTF